MNDRSLFDEHNDSRLHGKSLQELFNDAELCKPMYPDEAVDYGAAARASPPRMPRLRAWESSRMARSQSMWAWSARGAAPVPVPLCGAP